MQIEDLHEKHKLSAQDVTQLGIHYNAGQKDLQAKEEVNKILNK